MKFNAKVYVTLKPGVLDPQGKAVAGTLRNLGYNQVGEVRVGKYLTLELEADNREEAEEKLNEISHRVLANPVIEDYTFELLEGEE